VSIRELGQSTNELFGQTVRQIALVVSRAQVCEWQHGNVDPMHWCQSVLAFLFALVRRQPRPDDRFIFAAGIIDQDGITFPFRFIVFPESGSQAVGQDTTIGSILGSKVAGLSKTSRPSSYSLQAAPVPLRNLSTVKRRKRDTLLVRLKWLLASIFFSCC
jgi:hypothetical protein